MGSKWKLEKYEKSLYLSKTHNDFLETNIIERKIQKVPKI